MSLVSLIHAVRSECPPHGCSRTPRDVLFDEKAQAAIQTLKKSSAYSSSLQQQDALNELMRTGDEDHVTLTMMAVDRSIIKSIKIWQQLFHISLYFGGQEGKLCGVWDDHVSEFAVQQTPVRLAQRLENHFSINDLNDER